MFEIFDMRVRIIAHGYGDAIDHIGRLEYASIEKRDIISVLANPSEMKEHWLENDETVHDIFCLCGENDCAFQLEAIQKDLFPVYVIEREWGKEKFHLYFVHPDERERMHRYLNPPAISPSEQALIDIAAALKNSIELGLDRESALNDFNKRKKGEGDI